MRKSQVQVLVPLLSSTAIFPGKSTILLALVYRWQNPHLESWTTTSASFHREITRVVPFYWFNRHHQFLLVKSPFYGFNHQFFHWNHHFCLRNHRKPQVSTELRWRWPPSRAPSARPCPAAPAPARTRPASCGTVAATTWAKAGHPGLPGVEND